MVMGGLFVAMGVALFLDRPLMAVGNVYPLKFSSYFFF